MFPFFTPFQYLLDTPLSVTAFTQYSRACRNADLLHKPNEISWTLVNGSLELLRFGTNTRVGAKLSFQDYYLRLVDEEMEHI